MPRPKKFRNIRVLKENISFKPYDDEVTEFVEIFKDEFEVMRYIDLEDFKTSKTIDLESFYDTRNQKYATLNAPLNHIMDCNFMKYSLQLSMYAFFLEKYNFTPRNLTINHLVIKKWEDEPPITEPKYNINFENSKYYVADEVLYPVKYMKKEVKALLQYHKSKLK